MSDFDFLFGLIPPSAYRYIVMALLFVILFRQKIPILNKIDVTVRLPDEFMRHFRWITPLLIFGLWILGAMTNAQIRRLNANVDILQQQISVLQNLVVNSPVPRKGR